MVRAPNIERLASHSQYLLDWCASSREVGVYNNKSTAGFSHPYNNMNIKKYIKQKRERIKQIDKEIKKASKAFDKNMEKLLEG